MVKVNHIILGTCLFVIFAIQNADAGKDSNSLLKKGKSLLSMRSKKSKSFKDNTPNLTETKSSNNDDSNSSKPNSSVNNDSNSSPIQRAPVTPPTQYLDYSTSYSEPPAGLYHEDDTTTILGSEFNEFISQQERDAEDERRRAEEERAAREYQKHLQSMAAINGFFYTPYYNNNPNAINNY